METLVESKASLRDAVKWLNTHITKYNKTPAEMMKSGQSKKILRLLKKNP